ncbi:hypothetical protein [Thermoproteus tenax]|uniref:Uncharacterized protein n=1 Tax=Thermoproteus tenax (strain ATCC 35583 / DSM 2078 / JCM 9277 / NBRC 100435 / Kra 1) TaxID=768679 RepID=G4RKQ6_THETK|nr:hypothetical protein [Thermoproteus tenax]CCC82151.1 hypothetical protein TTX_1525 [Thermoproteus tenax Kra 1]
MIVFQTDFKCPRCGRLLTFVEDDSAIWLGCDHCLRYVKIDRRGVRRYWNYVQHRVLWRDLLRDLYESFELAVVS